MTSQPGVKRYNLTLPENLYAEVQQLAESRQTTVVDLLRRFIRLGLLVAQIESDSNTVLLIREGDTERQIVFL